MDNVYTVSWRKVLGKSMVLQGNLVGLGELSIYLRENKHLIFSGGVVAFATKKASQEKGRIL